jgi:hypothetical protein
MSEKFLIGGVVVFYLLVGNYGDDGLLGMWSGKHGHRWSAKRAASVIRRRMKKFHTLEWQDGCHNLGVIATERLRYRAVHGSSIAAVERSLSDSPTFHDALHLEWSSPDGSGTRLLQAVVQRIEDSFPACVIVELTPDGTTGEECLVSLEVTNPPFQGSRYDGYWEKAHRASRNGTEAFIGLCSRLGAGPDATRVANVELALDSHVSHDPPRWPFIALLVAAFAALVAVLIII